MLPFDRPYTISYYSSIVSIYPSCTVFEILTLICPKMKMSRDLDHAHLEGQFVITRQALLGPICAQNLTTLSLAIPEKFKGGE